MSDSLRSLTDHLRRGLRTDGPFRLASGATSDWYLDARQTTFDGEGARLVGGVILGVLEETVTAVGGMTMGADPIAIATAVVAGLEGRWLRAFSIRKSAKDHGAGGRLVGPVLPGDRAAVVEDTTTTGSALVEAIEVATSYGIEVVQAIALVDRSGGEAAMRLVSSGIPYRYLLTPADLGVG